MTVNVLLSCTTDDYRFTRVHRGEFARFKLRDLLDALTGGERHVLNGRGAGADE